MYTSPIISTAASVMLMLGLSYTVLFFPPHVHFILYSSESSVASKRSRLRTDSIPNLY